MSQPFPGKGLFQGNDSGTNSTPGVETLVVRLRSLGMKVRACSFLLPLLSAAYSIWGGNQCCGCFVAFAGNQTRMQFESPLSSNEYITISNNG